MPMITHSVQVASRRKERNQLWLACVHAPWQLDATQMHVCHETAGGANSYVDSKKKTALLSLYAVLPFLKWRETEGGV